METCEAVFKSLKTSVTKEQCVSWPQTVGHLQESVGTQCCPFLVCNYLKGLAGIGAHNRRPVLHGAAAAEGLASPMPLGTTKNVWDLFSVRKYDLSAPYRFHQQACILGPRPYLPEAPVGRKGGAMLTQSSFLKNHLAGPKRNRGSRSGAHASCSKCPAGDPQR